MWGELTTTIALRDLDRRGVVVQHAADYGFSYRSKVSDARHNRDGQSPELDVAIDARDNQPRPNLVYHLNSSENSPSVDVVTLDHDYSIPVTRGSERFDHFRNFR